MLQCLRHIYKWTCVYACSRARTENTTGRREGGMRTALMSSGWACMQPCESGMSGSVMRLRHETQERTATRGAPFGGAQPFHSPVCKSIPSRMLLIINCAAGAQSSEVRVRGTHKTRTVAAEPLHSAVDWIWAVRDRIGFGRLQVERGEAGRCLPRGRELDHLRMPPPAAHPHSRVPPQNNAAAYGPG